MSEFIKYYGLIAIFYSLELFSFLILKDIYENVIMVNILIRVFFVVLSALIIKNKVFNNTKNFYKIYYLVAFFNPFISSFSLFVLIYLFSANILITKIIADLFTSGLSFYVLKKS